jgi:hypothetical protein
MPEETTDQQGTTTEQQSTEAPASDQAGAPASGVEVEGTDDQSPDDHEEGQIELIGQDRFDALKGDPAALRKELNRAATKKFQQLSRSQDVLRPYVSFIKALDKNPREAIAEMAKQFGVELKGAEKTADPAETIDARIHAALSASLGEEYGDLTERLAPAIRQVAQMVAEEHMRPAQDQLESVIQDSALREANAAIATFGQKHPDWEQHEEAMAALSKRLPPGEGMEEGEYLDILYSIVTKDGATGDGVKKVIKRVAKAAEGAEGRDTSVSGKHVALTPGKLPSFGEAAAAARRGERFE